MNLKTHFKELMVSAMLNIVDATKGFGQEYGKKGERFPLFVKGGEKLGALIDAFIEKTPVTFFHRVLVSNDTHFKWEYPYSDEAQIFPDIHQEFGTEQHKYLFNLLAAARKWRVWEVLKNQFDVWATQKPLPKGVKLGSPAEEAAYKRLFMPTELSAFDLKHIQSLSMLEFAQQMRQHYTKTVVVIGIAQDYCVRDAMLGWLVRGFNVVLLTDLSVGIFNPDLPGGVGSLEELIEAHPALKLAKAEGRFRVMTSDEMLREAA